jgi:hypothetical protein
MKTEIFSKAIYNRNTIKFLYMLNEVTIDPYFISQDKSGKKIIYGKSYNSCEIKKFDFDKIVNIKVLRKNKFSPIIPIISQMN